MYKYYLINCFCIEDSNTQESLVLVTEYKLVGFFFFQQDFSIIYMLYIRYFCSERSPNRNVKDYRNVVLTMLWYMYFLCIFFFYKLLFYVEVISLCRYLLFK